MSQPQSEVFRVDVRKLPPNLSKEEFQQAIRDYQSNIIYQYYVPGQIKEKEVVFSRAHLNFNTQENGLSFLNNFKQKFADKQTNTVYEPVLRKSLYQINPVNKDQSSSDSDYKSGFMYSQFVNYQEQQLKLNEQKVDISQIERKANEETEEKVKKFEKVQTPIIASIEQKKKEERIKKMKEKINSGSTQIWVPKKNQN
ncbi:hypothetical protein ABPG72_012793 [Tetrahymena utriculariae]